MSASGRPLSRQRIRESRVQRLGAARRRDRARFRARGSEVVRDEIDEQASGVTIHVLLEREERGGGAIGV